MDLMPYLRMKVTDLTPNEYWETSRADFELSTDVHVAWRHGTEDAQREHKKREDRKARERKQEQDLLQR